jgi:hypothetical protein
MSYQAFQTLAFTQYGIPNQILEVVRPWVEKHARQSFHDKADDLGYAELGDVQSVEAGMAMLNEIISQSTMMETSKQTAKERQKFLKTAGGREGKDFYRYALKTYYLTLETPK